MDAEANAAPGTSNHEPRPVGAMTIDGFCRWAGIGRSLTYRLITSGELKAVKVGNRRLIRTADAQAWLARLA